MRGWRSAHVLEPALAILAVCATARPAGAQHPIVEIKVAGNQRLAAAAVIAASGLRQGQMATRADLDGAARRLADTGFFASVSYSYDPKTAGGATGYALTLHVSEQQALAPVELDIPGVDADQLWRQLKQSYALIDRQMPNTEQASTYYKRAIEAALKKSAYAGEIVLKTEFDLKTGKSSIICRPARAPRIEAIRFEGNTAIADRTLQNAMAKVAIGQEFTDRDFRRLLDYNVRPLYEELGRLTVSFPDVKTAGTGEGGVTVTAGIDEGPVWRLGAVVLKGDRLPLADMYDATRFAKGSPANWKEFTASVHKMEQVLRRDGYITVNSKPVRVFHDAESVVDVNLEVTKGAQYLFGELHIEGLDTATGQRLASEWQIPAGAPMNQPYIEEYLRSVMPELRGKIRSSSTEMHVHKGANVIDVTLKFH